MRNLLISAALVAGSALGLAGCYATPSSGYYRTGYAYPAGYYYGGGAYYRRPGYYYGPGYGGGGYRPGYQQRPGGVIITPTRPAPTGVIVRPPR